MKFAPQTRDLSGPTVTLTRNEAYLLSRTLPTDTQRTWAWDCFGGMVRNQVDYWTEYYDHIPGLSTAVHDLREDPTGPDC